MAKKNEEQLWEKVRERIKNPSVFDYMNVQIVNNLKDVGVKVDGLPDFALEVDRRIDEEFAPKNDTIGELVYTHTLVYSFLVNVFLGATAVMKSAAANECLRFIYNKTKLMAESRGLLDENGNLKE